jgi:hypothetical protein
VSNKKLENWKFNIKAVKRKRGPQWKVQLRTYSVKELKKAKKKCGHKADSITRDLPLEEYERYGFNLQWSIELAKERKVQLNLLKKDADEREARVNAIQRNKKEKNIKSAFLPNLLITLFEEKIKRDFYGDDLEWKRSKIGIIWKQCKNILKETEIEVKKWDDEKRVFYKYFAKKGWSYSYVEKLWV